MIHINAEGGNLGISLRKSPARGSGREGSTVVRRGRELLLGRVVFCLVSDLSILTTFFFNQQINLDIVMHLIIYFFIFYVCFEFNFFFFNLMKDMI